jgi:type IV pilus assembly protein PilA
MSTELRSKFIQYLGCKKKSDEGITLVEVLVVILIIGILSAIAIPNLLNQDAKAKQSEGKQNIALVNKSQNSFRAENNSFATSFDVLAIGTIAGNTTGTTTNYVYGITAATNTATVTGSPRDTALKGFSGATTYFSNTANMSIIGSVMCEMITIGVAATPPNALPSTAPTCVLATQNILSL